MQRTTGIGFKVWSLLQLAVLITAIQGTALFRHSHIIRGNRIEHSHPYSPAVPHSHTPQAAIALQAISVLHAETVSNFHSIAPEEFPEELYYAPVEPAPCFRIIRDYFLRPPPRRFS